MKNAVGGPLRLSGHAEMAYNTGQNVIQRGICDAYVAPDSSRDDCLVNLVDAYTRYGEDI